ncbi:MAG: VCBS repeat-containing protein [Caldilineaceae bacterium]|nr:VCBS repeat-containing protein [Caldilineaceae bacterium]
MGDLDGDGDLDAFITRRNNRPDKILLNDGLGNFGENTQGLGNFDSWGAALGDLDGDGDLDAFVANGFDNEANRVWFNNGIGVFSEGQSLGDDHSSSVALGDLDNDGDLDAFVANSERQADRVYLNDGSGNFQETFQGLGESSGSDVALGDWDNDGDLDALVVNFDGINLLWLNSGTGIFGQCQSWGTGESNSYYGLDVGDVDHDGDLDAFIADYAPNPGQLSPNEIWLNDGSGNFTKSNQNLSSSYSLRSFAVALGDLDNDGDLDAFIANDLTIFGPDGETFAEVWVNTNDQSFLPVISR